MELRVAAPQIEAAGPLREGPVLGGPEEGQPGPRPAQLVQVVLVVEAECLVPGHGHQGPIRRVREGRQGLRLQLRGGAGQREDPVQVGGLRQLIGHPVHLGGQVLHLVRGEQPQVAAWDGAAGQLGQVAQHRQAGLPLDGGGQQPGQPLGAAVEEHPGDLAGSSEGLHPLHQGGQSEGRPLWAHRQQDRGPGGLGHAPAAGPVRVPQAVIKSHDPLQYRQAAALGGRDQPGADLLLRTEKQVQVPAGHPQDRAVEHGVDIVGAALEGAGREPPPLGCPEQAAGERCFPAPAGGGGHHQPRDPLCPSHTAPPSENTVTFIISES